MRIRCGARHFPEGMPVAQGGFFIERHDGIRSPERSVSRNRNASRRKELLLPDAMSKIHSVLRQNQALRFL